VLGLELGPEQELEPGPGLELGPEQELEPGPELEPGLEQELEPHRQRPSLRLPPMPA